MSYRYMNSLYGGGQNNTDSDSDNDDYKHDNDMNEDTSELQYPSQEFIENVTQMKKLVYNAIIFRNENENSDDAQSLKLVDQYINVLGGIYAYLCSLAQGNPSNDLLRSVPQEAHDAVLRLIEWYRQFLTVNKAIEQRIPYESYLKNSLKHHPFTQVPEDN
jgi:hypothetical protein